MGHPTRRPPHRRRRPGRRGRSRIRREVRHQERHRGISRNRPPHPHPRRDRLHTDNAPRPRAHAHLLAARDSPRTPAPPPPHLDPYPRLPRPHSHQIPCLLHHLRGPSRCPCGIQRCGRLVRGRANDQRVAMALPRRRSQPRLRAHRWDCCPCPAVEPGRRTRCSEGRREPWVSKHRALVSPQERVDQEEAAVAAWIERHVRESPPLSDDQLRSLGEILGVKLIRRSATPA